MCIIIRSTSLFTSFSSKSSFFPVLRSLAISASACFVNFVLFVFADFFLLAIVIGSFEQRSVYGESEASNFYTQKVGRMSTIATYSTGNCTNRRIMQFECPNCSNVAREGRLTSTKLSNNFPAKRLCSDRRRSDLAPARRVRFFPDRTSANNAR